MSTETRPTTKKEQREATRAKLLAAARELFGERGYANVGTEEVVRAAGVTRGALYHQFADKQALFRAVLEEVEQEVLVAAAERMAAHPDDQLVAFKAGCRGWLEAAADPSVGRILLVDGPAVLGTDAWRELAEQYGLGVVKASLEHGMASGALQQRPADPLAHLLIGALDEAALYVARADDRPAALAEMTEIVDRLVDAFAA